jgi:hypothetical protein
MKNLNMKITISLLVLAIAQNIFANDLKYVCAEIDQAEKVKANGKTMLVTQLNSAVQTDGVSNPYLVEIFSQNSDVAEAKFKAISKQEDVILDLKKDRKNHVRIYLDELNQVYLTLKGRESFFNCLPMSDREQEAFGVQGVISDVTTGEIDPFIVGDACVIKIKTEEGHEVGLISDFDACNEATSDLMVGRGITVALTDKQRVRNSAKLHILREFSTAKAFYQVDFGTIENGLADIK